VAKAKKKALKESRILVFIDESGLSQRPHRCRTWAPRGQTPILQYKDVLSPLSRTRLHQGNEWLALWVESLPHRRTSLAPPRGGFSNQSCGTRGWQSLLQKRTDSVLGCAYPHDLMHPPVRYITWLIEKNLVPGAIVILHDGISDPTRSIQALPHILPVGSQRGLRFVSIGALVREAVEHVEAN
jgi:hypothetical protein